MTVAYLSIGSNIGDRLDHLVKSVQALHSHVGMDVLAVSSIYETAPVGYTDQADFLNIVVCVETDKSAIELLRICQEIEHGLGRVRTIRWGPRTVDLDILLYSNENIETEDLVVPHPRMHERAFVLIPLLEIAPMVSHPATGMSFSEEMSKHESGILIWKKIEGVQQFLCLKE